MDDVKTPDLYFWGGVPTMVIGSAPPRVIVMAPRCPFRLFLDEVGEKGSWEMWNPAKFCRNKGVGIPGSLWQVAAESEYPHPFTSLSFELV